VVMLKAWRNATTLNGCTNASHHRSHAPVQTRDHKVIWKSRVATPHRREYTSHGVPIGYNGLPHIYLQNCPLILLRRSPPSLVEGGGLHPSSTDPIATTNGIHADPVIHFAAVGLQLHADRQTDRQTDRQMRQQLCSNVDAPAYAILVVFIRRGNKLNLFI